MEELLKKEQELIRLNAEIDEKNRKLRERRLIATQITEFYE